MRITLSSCCCMRLVLQSESEVLTYKMRKSISFLIRLSREFTQKLFSVNKIEEIQFTITLGCLIQAGGLINFWILLRQGHIETRTSIINFQIFWLDKKCFSQVYFSKINLCVMLINRAEINICTYMTGFNVALGVSPA